MRGMGFRTLRNYPNFSRVYGTEIVRTPRGGDLSSSTRLNVYTRCRRLIRSILRTAQTAADFFVTDFLSKPYPLPTSLRCRSMFGPLLHSALFSPAGHRLDWDPPAQ